MSDAFLAQCPGLGPEYLIVMLESSLLHKTWSRHFLGIKGGIMIATASLRA